MVFKLRICGFRILAACYGFKRASPGYLLWSQSKVVGLNDSVSVLIKLVSPGYLQPQVVGLNDSVSVDQTVKSWLPVMMSV